MPSILDDSIELRHLRYFRAVAEVGNFTRAAAAIGLKQPTLSHQIRQLESALGSTLFERGRHACRLTAAGEVLLPHARRVLGEMAALRQSLDDESGMRRGSLTLAVLPVLAERVVAPAVSVFHRAYPGIQVKVLELSVDEMASALSTGAVDVCIGTLETSGTGFASQPLFEEELVAVVETRALRDGRTSLTVAELASFPVIVPPAGFGTRTLILNAWARARRSPIFALEANATEVVLQTVAAGGGVGIVPASALWGRNPVGWGAVRITRPVLRRQIGVFHAQVGNRRPSAQALMPLLWRAVEDAHARSPGPVGAVVLRTL